MDGNEYKSGANAETAENVTNEMAIKLADEEARNKIRNDIDTNFFVEAGAGSGKTTVLVARMVNMVKAGRDISRICAITFTKAAASEFYSRFRDELAATVDNKAAGWENCEAALRDIDLCFMGTIDSFCHMILSEHPSEAGIPSNSEILDTDAMSAYYRRKYKDIQGGKHGEKLRQKCRRFSGFHKDPSKVFAVVLSVIMARRNVDFKYHKPADESVDELLKAEKAAICGIVNILKDHPEAMPEDPPAECKKAWEVIMAESNSLNDDWGNDAVGIAYTLKKLKGLRLNLNWQIGQLGMFEDYFEEHIGGKGNKPPYFEFTGKTPDGKEKTIRFPEEIAQKIENLKYFVTMDFVEACIPIIEKEFRESGRLSYFDYLLYLRDMLKRDAAGDGKLIRHIYDRHSYFLIDEFQDTNPMQAEIFFYLAAKQIDSDWKKCIPHPGSLFIVGDPKQSIYRFRDADVGAFQRVKGLFSGSVGEALLLSCNFRSTNEMCRWFNRVFSDLLPEDNADQSKFSEIPIEKAKDPVGTFHGIYSYIRDERKTAKPEMKDTERVLSMVRRLVNNPAYTICGKDGQERKITYGDFMIITPTKTKISEYSDIFIRNRIPFLVEGSTVFSECPALVTLYSLYAAAADPNNRNCLYAALTGNYYCVSRNELIKYVNDGGKLNVFNPCADSINDSAEGDEDDSKSGEDITIEAKENRIEKALLEIRELYFSSKSLTPAALFVKIMDDCHIFEKTGTLNIEYIYYALELLRSGEASGEISSVKEASKFLESLISDEAEIERYLSLSRAKDRIHIANLHKVKGLEAPIVILASPQKKKRSPQMRVDISGENPMGWIFEVSKKKKKDVYESIIKCSDFPKEQEVERISKNAENIRLLYVAATRARNALIVGSYVNAGKPGNYGAENAWLELLKYCERDFFESVPEKNMPSSIDREFVKATDIYADNKDNVFDRYTSGKAGYSIKLPSQIKLKSRLSSEDDYEDIAEEKTDKRRNTNKKRNPALIGTLVHRLMEVLISSKNRADIKASVMEICSEYDADDADGYYRNILMKVGEKIRKGGYTQENGSKTDVLKLLLSAEEVHCEVPFCYRETSNAQNDSAVIWHGVMDVIYKKDGRWHIIDYKTNYEESDLDEKYRGQLQAYIRAFKEMTGEEADAEIYHIEVTE